MQLFDSARRAVVPFEPGPVVTMYTCGITPYDSAHLGHISAYLAYDVLQRRLRDLGHQTRCVRNVTDVDDDILRKARSLGVHYLDLAAEETARFDQDMAAMGMIPSASEPRATSAISDILRLTGRLFDVGAAYATNGAVYFDTGSSDRFGKLFGLDRDRMLKLATEHGGKPDDPNKRDPLDFVLRQPSLEDEPSWESRWGAGRPGWHVECSSLVLRELGDTIDLHGGGSDLIFPHHECEAVAAETSTGVPFARHWMHAGMLRLDGEKMSKSLGNLVYVRDLLKTNSASAIRLALIAQHYRESYEWSSELLDKYEALLEGWRY
ncbi:MAG TPA: class I tRNA ligase family protein, partial [Acidimicrobiales bacterium]|nr:class I tRNA ligase family protein [Acidimicrobiales bacterium]